MPGNHAVDSSQPMTSNVHELEGTRLEVAI
jgi:hypothetical protein